MTRHDPLIPLYQRLNTIVVRRMKASQKLRLIKGTIFEESALEKVKSRIRVLNLAYEVISKGAYIKTIQI